MFSRAYRGEDVSGNPPEPGPSSNQGSSRRLSDGRLDAQWARRRHGTVRRRGLGVGSLVHLGRRAVPVRLPLSFLVSRQLRIPAPACAAGCAQRPGALPARDEQARYLALAAPPQRHGHSPGHDRGRLPGRVRGGLRVRGLLPGPCAVRRGLPVAVARVGLDDDDRRRLCRRSPGGQSPSQPHCGRWKGAGGQAGGDVRPGVVRQSHRPLRTRQEAGRGGRGAPVAAGTHRALPGHSRYDGAVGVHDRPGHRRRQNSWPETPTRSSPPGSKRPHGCPRPPSGS